LTSDFTFKTVDTWCGTTAGRRFIPELVEKIIHIAELDKTGSSVHNSLAQLQVNELGLTDVTSMAKSTN